MALPEWAQKKLDKDKKKGSGKKERKKATKFKVEKKLLYDFGNDNLDFLYSIGSFVSVLGVALNTILNWEKKGYVKATFVDTYGNRWYSKTYMYFVKDMYVKKTKQRIWLSLCKRKGIK